jgi:hypothetical protein
MVATGVADFVVLLAPERWPTEACEHDATDAQHRFPVPGRLAPSSRRL